MAPVVTMSQLLEAGVHYGHRTQRWNPQMRPYIHSERQGIYIIDLRETLHALGKTYMYVRDLTMNGGTILFVGTKTPVVENIRQHADRCGMPYVNERWLGGTLTNFATISLRSAKLQEYQDMLDAGDFEKMPKKEALQHQREMSRLRRNLGGIRYMQAVPDAVFVVDTQKEQIAVKEAKKLDIPIIAVVDTNCNPGEVDIVIPGNDDSILAGEIMCRVVSEAVIAGKELAKTMGMVPKETEGAEGEPESKAPEEEVQQSELKESEPT